MLRNAEKSLPAAFRSALSTTRLGQFLLVGGLGAVVDTTSLFVIVEMAALPPSIAAFGSKELSILVMFVLNDRWTFRDTEARKSLPRRVLSSNVVRVGGAIIGIAVLTALVRWFGVWYPVANVLGIGVGFVSNYVFENLVTWRGA